MGEKTFVVPIDKTGWKVQDGSGAVQFSWDYDSPREKLLNLYEKGKRRQWDAKIRIDWNLEIDHDNPLGSSDDMIPLFGAPIWTRLSEKNKIELRRHIVAWQFSQFLHGEQGALICASKIVQTVPELDAKYYAATQVFDEARHMEVYSTYLDKLGLAYPINPNLKSLLENVLTDSRWDMTYLGMQVLIEGLALAAFGLIRNFTTNELGRTITAYVMQDEARHVTFGRNALKDFYPQLSSAERQEREEFAAEACLSMRDRFLSEEVWAALGYDVGECVNWMKESPGQTQFRSFLFMRIVPILRDIGLWGPTIRESFEKMGIIGFADTDVDEMMKDDEAQASAFDKRRVSQVQETIESAESDTPDSDQT
ncbi:MAG: ferritin-like domain-containing protein [Acidimicrobiaceae bacterium]|nr:ferritin-like domain-containing protein [Acidimicrobiaceae bacterium]